MRRHHWGDPEERPGLGSRERKREPSMTKQSRAPWRAFVVLALIAAGVAALAATTGRATAAAHVMTPAVLAGAPHYQFIGTAPEAASNVVAFGCQTRLPSTFPSSSCYGP